MSTILDAMYIKHGGFHDKKVEMAYARAPHWHFLSFIFVPNFAIVGVIAYKPSIG
jgi:hypothetical protein